MSEALRELTAAHAACDARAAICALRGNRPYGAAVLVEPAPGLNVEVAYVPFYASWLNRIEAHFTALRYFALEGTDPPSHQAQGRMIRRYISWRNRNPHDRALRELVKRANVA